MAKRPLLTILCPVHNEEKCIGLFYDRLQTAIQPLRDRYDLELLFSNNGSVDGTLTEIHKLRASDPSVQVLSLSRNFGYEASIATALRQSRGDAIAVIDVDCEDPPELIPRFVEEWQNGHGIVYGQRDRRQEFIGLHLTRKLFYRLTRLLADNEIILDMANFFLLSAGVRDAILAQRSTQPFLRGEVAYVGFSRKGIPYERQSRLAGHSHYSLLRLVHFALVSILSASTWLLRLPAYLLPVAIVANLALLATDKFQWLVALDFLYIAFVLAILAVYLARTHRDVVQRPISVIDWDRTTLNNPSPRSP